MRCQSSQHSNIHPIPFISFEGPDGSGKSTQASMLSKWLRSLGFQTTLTYEPGDTDFGQKMRDVLLHGIYELDPITELLLYAADRREHVKNVIIPSLRKKHFVICDRYVDSTIAYQAYGRNIDIHIVEYINNIVTDGLSPTITFFLDLAPEVSMQRLDVIDNTEGLGAQFYQKVVEGYAELAKREPNRFVIIDMDESTNSKEVFSKIKKHIVKIWPIVSEAERIHQMFARCNKK